MIRLQDEIDLLEPVFAQAGESFTLVGHSYGGASALLAALRHPGRVRALALYEPTLFSVVDARQSPPNGADGIRNTVLAAAAARDSSASSRHTFSPHVFPADTVLVASLVRLLDWTHATRQYD